MTRSGVSFLVVLGLAAATLFAQTPLAGKGTIFVGSYSGHLTAIDEATGTITKTPLKIGAPSAVRLSPDRSRFYVLSANYEHFEIVDARTRQTLDTFTLSSGQRHIRALAFEVDPQHKTLMVVTRPATRLIDRWEIGDPVFLVYDLATHTITRTVPWTIDPEPASFAMALRFSPDGRFLYCFANRVTIFDAASMEQVDSWDLSVPADPAMGRFDPGSWDDSADPRGSVTSLFTMSDAVMNRRLLVVGQIDLAAKTVDTFTLGPAPTSGGLAFTMSPDRRHANVLSADIGRHELWTIDMAARVVTNRVEVPTRTRMQMRTSETGLLYLYEAGSTIDVFSADAKTRLRTIQLDSDMMYATFVIVPAAPAAAR